MIDTDRTPFFRLVADVYAFYGREFSDFAGTVWWAAMRPFDLAAVNDAFGRHCVNPDAGQYLPKPADIVRMLQGSTQDAAMVAWSLVDKGIRTIGTYASVVFDDPVIHRVISEMGGWVALGTRDEKEWPFVAREFQNRYRGYRMRSDIPEHPRQMIGIAEAQNSREGRQSQPPVLIGDPVKAKQVLLSGTDKPLIGFQRLDESKIEGEDELLTLAEPSKAAA